MRLSKFKLNNSLKKQIIQEFVQVITDLKNPKETQTFLEDFFNEGELETFSKRLAIAYYLHKGRSYNNIKNNLKVSSATIATVQLLVNSSGLKLALKKMEADEWANKWVEKIKGVIKK